MKDEEKWSVYGGYGFVLGEFCRQYSDEVIRISKIDTAPQSPKILYGISTIHNYNVFDSPTLDVETNLVHFMEVLDACHTRYGNKFEFNLISSWFVYGKQPTDSTYLHEDSYCNPTGFYSITARCREQLLISYCETFGIKYRILRLANVLGAKDRKVSAKKNALQFLIDKLIMGEPIELYDDGQFFRDYIDVRDCAKAIHAVISSQLPYPIWNISNGTSHKFRDLIEHASEYSKSKSTIFDTLHKPEFHKVVQAKNIFLSNDRLRETGYVPEFTIQKTIEDIIDEYKR